MSGLKQIVEELGGTALLGGVLIQFTDTTFKNALKKIYEAGVTEEREACAKLCEEADDDEFYFGRHYAEAIRARGQND